MNNAYSNASSYSLEAMIERDRDHAIAAEVERLMPMFAELLKECDIARVTFSDISGGPMPQHAYQPFNIDLAALIETIAVANVEAVAAMNREAE